MVVVANCYLVELMVVDAESERSVILGGYYDRTCLFSCNPLNEIFL